MYERLRSGVITALRPTPVVLAYLFGSHARGTAAPGSDVDVGVHLGRSGVTVSERLDIVRRIRDSTGVETDVVVLDDAPLRLIERVLRDGRLLYSADEVARVTYESTMRKLCADFAIHADRLDRELIRATAEGRR